MTGTLSIPLQMPGETAAPQPLQRGTPCTMVILGANGDLTRRKLMPALFHLMSDGLLSDDFDVIGIGRSQIGDGGFRDAMRDAVESTQPAGAVDPSVWSRFADRLGYVSGDVSDAATYAAVRDRLSKLERRDGADNAAARGRLFYLALPPSAYETALVHLSESNLAPRLADADRRSWARIIVEKPFGQSLASARALNRMIRARFAEHQIFRIDHYLGKETVQNLLVFRFANLIFEPVWNRDHIDHVQITAAESAGVEHRAGYYEESGVLRDMFQNHLLQLLALTAMEPPVAFRAEAVRSEKVKVLDAIRPMSRGDVHRYSVVGQYGPGTVDGRPVPGYRDEKGVDPHSSTPTYAALRLLIDNWRWQGVPFFLRSGKRLPRRATEVAIRFRQPPHLMFPLERGEGIAPNVLAFRIQPNEGISLCFQFKVPDHRFRMSTATMNFSYAGGLAPSGHSAYETLLLDCMLGDATLFTRSDAVEATWRLIDPITTAWEEASSPRLPNYSAGEWGPIEADALIRNAGAEWRIP